MKLNNTQLLNYVARIRLTQAMKNTYARQIDDLVSELCGAIDEHTDMRVTRVLRAGSWKKGTALRPRAEHPLDIDLVFFLDLEESSAAEVSVLHDTLLAFLKAAYPNKSEDDFKGGQKTVGLVFRGSGLMADLVPVVPLKSDPAYVWQPSIEPGGGRFVTSVERQLEFVQQRKAANPAYSATVRMLKAWKARKELEVSSFAIELTLAHLDLTRGTATNIEDAALRAFEYLCRSTFPPILFPGAIGMATDEPGPAYVADPTNNANNVLKRLDAAEWARVREAALAAWEALSFAQSKASQAETLELWKEVFGPRFNIEPPEET
ncbi:MAG: CBASS oligonucleotide cyclase [Myxococcota bacterium]